MDYYCAFIYIYIYYAFLATFIIYCILFIYMIKIDNWQVTCHLPRLLSTKVHEIG